MEIHPAGSPWGHHSWWQTSIHASSSLFGLKTQKSIGLIIEMGYKPTKEECSDIIRVGKSFSGKNLVQPDLLV
jgi:hypothetical protein